MFAYCSLFHIPAYKSKSALWIAIIPCGLEKCTLQEVQAEKCDRCESISGEKARKSAFVLFSDLKQCGTIKGKKLLVRYGHIGKVT